MTASRIIALVVADLHFVFAEPFDPQVVEKARALGKVTILDRCDEESLRAALADCDALLVRTRARVTGDVLRAGSRLRVIGRAGVGLENIDIEAARERGIRVVYTPAAATDAVADLAVGMMIALVRRLPWYDSSIRQDRFDELRDAVLPELRDQVVGIVGMGRIGRAVARRCHLGFGMAVLYNDVVPVLGLGFPAKSTAKEDLYRQSDIVSLHVPLAASTEHLIDETALGQFRPGAILINTARGRVVDSAALTQALREGRLGGAGLDVFDPEPLPPGHPLLSAPNTLLTPHIGARTARGSANMNSVIDDVIRVLSGQQPLHAA